MQPKTILKAILVGCILIAVFGILVAAGCLWCGFNLFGGLFRTLASTAKIQAHFRDLESRGWEVDDSESKQPEGYGTEVQIGDIMIWRAREKPEDEWTYYVWEAAVPELEEADEDVTKLLDFMLLPRTQAALEVHRELKLPLPENFELREWKPVSDKYEGSDGSSGLNKKNKKLKGKGGEDDSDTMPVQGEA